MRFSASTLSAMPRSAKKSLVIFVYLALILSTVAVFWQVRNFDFTNYDDNLYVTENQHVLSGLTADNIFWAFTTGHTGYWHPLTWLSLMLDCQLFGPNPGRMHLINLLLHLANTLLLFAILKKITAAVWPSAFVAAAFALHPMHVESVAWIAERKDVLSTLFLLLTLTAYLSYVRHKSLFSYILAVMLFGLGILAKPILVTLPFILLLLDYWPLNRFEPQAVKPYGRQFGKSSVVTDRRAVLYRVIIEKVPFFMLSVLTSLVTFAAQSGAGIAPDVNALPLSSRVTNALLSYTRYIGKMLWPQNLAAFYPFDIGNFTYAQVVLCAILLLVISIFVIGFGRKQKYLLFGWFWFIVTLAPVIGLIQSGTQAYADRYTYVSYIGLFIMIAWGLRALLSKWPYRKIVFGISMPIVLTILGMCTWLQVSYWKNSSTLFLHALEVTQDNYIAHFNLADDLLTQGKPAVALEHYKKALKIMPGYSDAALSIGYILAGQGDLNQAVEYFKKAIQLTPDSLAAHYNLAVAMQKQGRLDEAAAHFTKVIQIAPDMPSSMNDLALLIATHPEIKNRDVNEAIRLARRACELTNYHNPAMLGTLAAAYAAAARFSEAVDTARKAIAIADSANQPQIKNIIQYHLTFYAQGKPYIEPAAAPFSDAQKP
jgi:Flp pilus assembly protein TadD